MDAKKVRLYHFITEMDAEFIIPVYQRNYDWKKEHCQQLLRDVLAIVEEAKAPVSPNSQKRDFEHFLGSIVFVPDGEENKKIVIDGQQRLTTVTLLYIALANAAKNDEERKRIRERYLINGSVGSEKGWEKKIKLRATEGNDDAMRYLLLRGDAGYNSPSRLVENYRFFAHEVAENAAAIEDGLKKLSIVQISVDKKDNPQRIFESMNSTGLALSQADLIRNYILMNLSAKAQEQVYLNYWHGIEESALDDKTREDRVTQFVRHFLTMKKGEIPALDTVYPAFKRSYPNLSLVDASNNIAAQTEVVLEEMHAFARLYGKLLNPAREENKKIRRHLEFLNRLVVDVSHPFLLKTYHDYSEQEISLDEFIQTLEVIQSYVWRRFIVGLSTSGMNKTFAALYLRVRAEIEIEKKSWIPSLQITLLKSGGMQRFPGDKEVLSALDMKDIYRVKSNNRNYFLERMENHDIPDPIDIWDNENITVEHILPQKLSPEWRNNLNKDEIQWMTERMHTAANLTLSGNNGQLGNKSFLEKRDMNKNGGKQGYKFSNLPMTRALEKLEKWGQKEMSDRMEKEIKPRFVKVWPFPPVELKKGEYISIFDVDTLDSVQLHGFIFFGKEYPPCSASEMYQTVVESLFDLAPEKFIGGNLIEGGGLLGEKIKLDKAQSALANPSPRPLGGDYYYELARNNDSKIRILRALLKDFDSEEELQIQRCD